MFEKVITFPFDKKNIILWNAFLKWKLHVKKKVTTKASNLWKIIQNFLLTEEIYIFNMM